MNFWPMFFRSYQEPASKCGRDTEARSLDISSLHSGFFLFRFETSKVHFMSRKTDVSPFKIYDLASKGIFFFAFFAIIDQLFRILVRAQQNSEHGRAL